MRDRVLLGLATLTAVHAGCLRSAPYACDEHSQCVLGADLGTCEDVGFCSFSDDACPSGSRFADGAGPYANQCVATSSSVDAAVVDAALDGAPATDAAIDAPGIDGGITIGCTDPGNGTPFPVGPACGGWGTSFRDNAAVQNNGGRLVITPVPNEGAANAGCDHVAVPFAAAGVFAEVDRVLDGATSRTRLELGNRQFTFGVEGGQLVARAGGTALVSAPYAAAEMRWWRMRPMGGVLFEVSPNGTTWTVFATATAAAPASATIRIIGETVQAEPTPGSARIRSVNVCP
jgi:hypothetical protein